MVRPVLQSALLLSLLLGAACTSGKPVVGGGGLRAIDEAEILASEADDVLEIIQDARPSWLLGTNLRNPSDPHDPGEGSAPLVLINDIPPVPLWSLGSVPLDGIKEIRYLTPIEAGNRFRLSAPNGLIVVIRPVFRNMEGATPPDTGRAPVQSIPATDSSGVST